VTVVTPDRGVVGVVSEEVAIDNLNVLLLFLLYRGSLGGDWGGGSVGHGERSREHLGGQTAVVLDELLALWVPAVVTLWSQGGGIKTSRGKK